MGRSVYERSQLVDENDHLLHRIEELEAKLAAVRKVVVNLERFSDKCPDPYRTIYIRVSSAIYHQLGGREWILGSIEENDNE